MGKELGPYDKDLQMFKVREPLEFDLNKLRFMRFLAENGKLEHEVFGVPFGEYAERLTDIELRRIVVNGRLYGKRKKAA